MRFQARRWRAGRGAGGARPWAQRIDRVLKPRLTFLATAPFVFLIALACIAAALVTFPLGLIPFAPLAPGFAIVFFGLGMTARDGLFLALGLAAVGLAGWAAWPIVEAMMR
ncbi:MAG: exopolysaccharide biosynthesis protein [Hyphomonadaceae bacterium]